MLPIVIGLVVAIVIFAVLWRQGAFLKLSVYVEETKEELRKCTWPTWEELWDSTKIVMLAIGLLGGFTVLADLIFAFVIKAIV